MSFFIKGKQSGGVKRGQAPNRKAKKRKPDSRASKNEEITSSEDEDLIEDKVEDFSASEDENETAQEKKVRLAKVYLEEIEREEKARLEKEEIDQSVISKRLKEDYLKETGKLRLTVADKYKQQIDLNTIKTLKCKHQRNSLTCSCISSDNEFLFSGSKDGVVIKYSLKTFLKVGHIPFVQNNNTKDLIGHSSEILSLAISTDNKYLAVGDKIGNVHIWDPNTLKHIKTLTGHKNSIYGLCFKKESHTLYSCSKDKTIKVWSLDEMAYVETLFGHQDIVASIDTLYRDRVVTSGGHDLRVWKITEETQLIYNGHLGNIDNVRLINEEHFVSAGDDGQICIWSVMRKKPLQCIESAHGKELLNEQPRWITAVAALMNTDLIASGSYDGYVRLWKLEDTFKKSKEISKIPVDGIVNALCFTSDGLKLLVSVSRDYRLGRWNTVKTAKNCILVIPFIISS
ncbi:unnamed protein product [Ceutorhynchus assimilis]|uniref:U3 small nucleolar RNA-interacting protein 2 n=1 Tax=Ceutorhynchus assimilis TaxID=467358 RepID=A0A9N9MQ95_9CUCU|nr:unnamed protein product [Ceutorhynchus assimilis]